jgi:hypothetical protein
MSNPYDRKTQPAEWQAWLNEQIRQHDEEVKKQQAFEISQKDDNDK